MATYVLAIDQGTTNSKALLIGETGEVAARSSVAVPVRYPQPGWVEQSGAEIWATVVDAVRRCLAQVSERPSIGAIGLSNQRESVLLWDRRSGEPIGPCVTWQCRRSSDRIDHLRNPRTEALVAEKTGLGLDPLFPAAKIAWLLDAHRAEARLALHSGNLCAGTIDAWLVFKLTGGGAHATDVGNASRTQLLDIRRVEWDDELCALFEVPKAILPQIRGSDADFGLTAVGLPIPKGVPIHAMMGDSHAALFGHGIRTPGFVKATYGTGSSLMTLTDEAVRSTVGLSTTIAWQCQGRVAYALEGNISVSAQAAAWVAELLGLTGVDALTALAATASDTDGVWLVPAFAGLGAPHWNDRARAVLSGLSLSTTRGQIARATLEAIAFQIGDVFTAMESDIGRPLDLLSVDGTPTRNEFLMQCQADVISRPVHRHPISELSAAGSGAMAAVAAGIWSDGDASAFLSQHDRTFIPALEEGARLRRLADWQAAVRMAIDGAGRVRVGPGVSPVT